jgi:hypothetical protein
MARFTEMLAAHSAWLGAGLGVTLLSAAAVVGVLRARMYKYLLRVMALREVICGVAIGMVLCMCLINLRGKSKEIRRKDSKIKTKGRAHKTTM